jgi:hypothetical protein
MKHEVGDLVYWEKDTSNKYVIEALSTNMRFDDNYWIWSSKFDTPYLSDGSKNFHKPNSSILGNLINVSKIREEKLNELGL